MTITRRELIGAGATLAAGSMVAAGAARAAEIVGARETIALWPARPPGSRGTLPSLKIDDQSHDLSLFDRWITGIATPELVVCRPSHPNGAAVLLIPGGGYGFLAYDNEGTSQARWLNALGLTAFILVYRLPGEGWADRAEVPLQDAQRAIRIIRARASQFAVDPKRIAAIGFSAGGHLAGSLATRFAEPTYTAVDTADRRPARPDLVGMIYPVVSLSAPFTHGGSRDNLLGPDSPDADRRRRSIELLVTADTPPLFLVHASDDGLVPVRNSLSLYDAVLAAGRKGELHVFDEGGHGFGVRANPALPVSHWPRLFTSYAALRGIVPA